MSPAHSLCVLTCSHACVYVCVTEICQGPDPAGHGVWPSEPAGEGLLWLDFPGHGQLQGQTHNINTNTQIFFINSHKTHTTCSVKGKFIYIVQFIHHGN